MKLREESFNRIVASSALTSMDTKEVGWCIMKYGSLCSLWEIFRIRNRTSLLLWLKYENNKDWAVYTGIKKEIKNRRGGEEELGCGKGRG